MNERIQELLVKADIKFDRDINEIEVCVMLPSDLEKFAELIVQECAQKGFDVFDEEPDATCDAARYYVRDKIKEHFGVEE